MRLQTTRAAKTQHQRMPFSIAVEHSKGRPKRMVRGSHALSVNETSRSTWSRSRVLAALGVAIAAVASRPATAFCSVGMKTAKGHVHVCTNTSCRKADSRYTLDTFRAFAPADVEVIETGCQGRAKAIAELSSVKTRYASGDGCGLGPNIMTRPSEEVYQGVAQPPTVAAIIEIEFGFPVADKLVGAYDHISKGEVLYKRNLFAGALECYTKCIEIDGAFEGNANALSVAKVKQSSAMRMVVMDEKRRNASRSGTGAATSTTLEEAEASAREAVKLWPAHTAAWLNLSDVLVDMGRVEEALETLATLKAEFPDAKFEASEKAARIRNTQR